MRLGRPVSGSWVAWCARRCSNPLALADVAGDHRQPADATVDASVGQALHGDGDLDPVPDQGQLAGPDPLGAQDAVDLAVELGDDPRRDAGLEVRPDDVDVDQSVELLSRPVHVERVALGVGHHDQVARGLDDPGQAGVGVVDLEAAADVAEGDGDAADVLVVREVAGQQLDLVPATVGRGTTDLGQLARLAGAHDGPDPEAGIGPVTGVDEGEEVRAGQREGIVAEDPADVVRDPPDGEVRVDDRHHVQAVLGQRPEPALGRPGLGHVQGVDAEVGVVGVVQAVLDVHPRPPVRAVRRAQPDLQDVGGAGLADQLVPAEQQVVVHVDPGLEAAEDLLVVALGVDVAEEAEEARVDVCDLEAVADAGDQLGGEPGLERERTRRTPGCRPRGSDAGSRDFGV